ncbi:MAG TPA: OB-fold nucleic acid binding domain-containing protein [Phycisphaerales bacterium]|nr:OB-fold nucleic acid binding domain-containing protein [Phycisphaerales bacterium]
MRGRGMGGPGHHSEGKNGNTRAGSSAGNSRRVDTKSGDFRKKTMESQGLQADFCDNVMRKCWGDLPIWHRRKSRYSGQLSDEGRGLILRLPLDNGAWAARLWKTAGTRSITRAGKETLVSIASVADVFAGKMMVGDKVTVRGWVRTRRDSKAGLSFVHVHDGSCFDPIQAVVPSALGNYANEVMKLTTGCSVEVSGVVSASQGKG